MLLNANRVTQIDTLVEELWGAEPPASMMTTIQTYVYQLRKRLLKCRIGLPAEPIVTRPHGYQLQVDRDQIDVHRFEQLARPDPARLERDPAGAIDSLERALRLWQGPALADVPRGSVLTGHVARLEEIRMHAVEMRIEAGLRLGLHRQLVGELQTLVRHHPYNEQLHAHLMRALALCGRRHEALAAYHRLRDILHGELGLEPSGTIRRIQQQVLNGELVAA